MIQQNSHWYKTDDRQGWTANPAYASTGEVERRGLHSCTIQGCTSRHSASAEERADDEVRASQIARKAKGN